MSSQLTRALLISFAATAGAQAQYVGPTPYLSAADSPFTGTSFGYFHLEDFEDDTLTPGLTAHNGIRLVPGPFTDSVDADDGAIDGSGLSGGSYFSNGSASTFEFAFDSAALGALPTHAGLVWTDVGDVLAGAPGVGSVRFEAFDGGNVSLGVHGPFTLGDGSATGATAEDRFFGIVHLGGISRITITMPDSVDWEVDHVQYALIPAPGSALMLIGAGGMLLRRQRKQQ